MMSQRAFDPSVCVGLEESRCCCGRGRCSGGALLRGTLRAERRRKRDRLRA